jgi:hypothetical protein
MRRLDGASCRPRRYTVVRDLALGPYPYLLPLMRYGRRIGWVVPLGEGNSGPGGPLPSDPAGDDPWPPDPHGQCGRR